MIHFDWLVLLTCVSAAMVLALHATIQRASTNRGVAQERALGLAGRLYIPVCMLVLATAIAILSREPRMAESFGARPELWIVPMVAAAGLLGVGFCMGARWNPGTVFCSLVFLAGLAGTGAFVYRHFSNIERDTLAGNVNAQAHSDSGRPTLGSRVAGDNSHGRGL